MNGANITHDTCAISYTLEEITAIRGGMVHAIGIKAAIIRLLYFHV